RRRHTRSKRDWSSDVCSSDLSPGRREAAVHTSMVVRQDSLTLYGFASSAERDAFELVQTASGVGPRLAAAMVSVLSPSEIRRAEIGRASCRERGWDAVRGGQG